MAITEITGIDPGSKESGVVGVALDGAIVRRDMWENARLARALNSDWSYDSVLVAIEHVVPYSQLGHSILDTILWIGRFVQAREYGNLILITRHEVKLHFCHRTSGISDGDVNDAVVHRLFGHSDRKMAVGTKKAPGPLHGISGHLWPALAVALVALDRHNSA